MKVIDYFLQSSGDREYWLSEMKKTDWGAAGWLCSLTEEGKVEEAFGKGATVYLLVEGRDLLSLCTLAPQDEIDDISMTPWIGFVYTFPRFRGRRCSGTLIAEVSEKARAQGYDRVWVSSEEVGLYEKYGFTFVKKMQSVHGYETGVFVKMLR